MRSTVMFAALAASISGAVAAPGEGTWTGSYDCNGIVRELMLDVGATKDGGVRAVFAFSGGGVAGAYSMTGHIDPATNTVVLDPEAWISQPDGYAMVGLDGVLADGRIVGRVEADGCGVFEVTRQGDAPSGDPASAQNGGLAPTASSAPDFAGSALEPFAKAASANPAAIPGQPSYPYVGNWAIDIPGGAGIWTKQTEIDWARQLAITTHELTIRPAASNAGALQIAPDGTYRMAWLTGKWQGRWERNADPRFPNSVLLHHPTNAEDDWIVFRNDAGDMEARDYPYMGLAADRMHPIETAALAEYLLAVQDALALVGEWVLYPPYDLTDAQGSLSVGEDGRYRLEDDLMNRSSDGRWQQGDELLKLLGGTWGEGDAYLKFGAPGQATVIAGGSEWVAIRR